MTAKIWKMYRLDEESDKIISEILVEEVAKQKKSLSKQEVLNNLIHSLRIKK